MTLTKTQRQRRSRRLALFNSYQSVFNRANPTTRKIGNRWYPRAHRAATLLADTTGSSVPQTAAVISALSPGTRWTDNLKSAWGALSGDWDTAWGWHAYGSTGVDKAQTILERNVTEKDRLYNLLDTPSSNKVPSFYRSILLEEGAVCVDSWIYRINQAGYRSESAPKGYTQAAQEAIRMLASKQNLSTFAMQAILWVQTRKENGQKQHPDSISIVKQLIR